MEPEQHPVSRIRVRMRERDTGEPHRASSPLELLFDLTFVVAVAAITAQLAHGIADGHGLEELPAFLQVFFAIWWAWMNFTWFASSYDTDDVPYRLLTMVQMAGVLVLAAGVPAGFEHSDYRAISIVQVGWIARLVLAEAGSLPEASLLPVFIGLAACELAVPRWAERSRPTSWH